MSELEAPLVVQANRGFHVLSLAEVIDDTKETAASWAGEHIQLRPDFGWIVGRYVEADKPNRNGHIFPMEDLRASHQGVVHTYLNMLHRQHHVVGTFTAAKLLEGVESAVPFAASEQAAMLNPHVEAVSAFWRYAFPDEYRATQAAFRDRSAWLSMEAVPRRITCTADNLTFDYKGPAHDSYCEHLLASPRAQRRLNQPHFVGGAVIIPPTRPGWAHADIRDVAGVIEKHLDEAEMVYETVAAAASHLDPKTWEAVMAKVLAHAFPRDAVATARQFSTGEREKLAKSGEAMSDGSFPIKNAEDLKNAISAYGRAKNRAAAKRHIMKRARSLGLENLIPEEWKGRETAATSMPANVRAAYDAHLAEGGWEPDPQVNYQAHPYKGGVLHMVADGWGEWFFAEVQGQVAFVAQKMADVRAFHVAEGINIGKPLVKQMGWGDKAWIAELITQLEKAQPDVKPKPAAAALEDISGLILEAAATKKGAIVALVPPPAIAEDMAKLGKELPEEMHVTLVFLGEIADGGGTVALDDKDPASTGQPVSKERVLGAVAAFCAGAPALPKAAVSGLGAFALGDDRAVIYASLDVPGLPETRERLVASLKAAGVPVSTLHGFSPHMSLEYTTAADAAPRVDAFDGDLPEWVVDHLEVWWDGEHISYELAGGKVALPA
jgi:2'-5' RNA ligase